MVLDPKEMLDITISANKSQSVATLSICNNPQHDMSFRELIEARCRDT
jgi:hypothetical protein